MSHEMTSTENPGDRLGDLTRLAQRANEAHHRVAESLQQAVANALEVGRALLEAREICTGGKFTAWLKANFAGGLSTARGYMRLAVNWNQLGGDLQRAGELSQRQLAKLLKGLPGSDGRANPYLVSRQQAAAPAGNPAEQGNRSTGSPPDETGLPVAFSGDPLEPVGRLLEQAVAELRRLCRADAREACYARHLLQPLELIHRGIPTRQWFWEIAGA